ncbi:hypothetical protein [Planobispora longispora]|uniref:Uncharacterized protein n=1 Tax=Planobispora longispora TaxID=28887 RepID=A0A8J3RSP2_9ACTN|nr:hypothetical protein [Planobispora longispora]GIH80005.1 hypothetical protein Plo01_64340 [Planobispora longispora]
MTRWNRPLLVLSGIMAVLALVALVGVFADDRVLTGAPVWLKVFKFAVSFTLYGVTLAWMLSVLPTRGRVVGGAAVLITATSAVEMLIITAQAARGRASHFNETTSLDTVLWQIMSVSIMILWLSQLALAVAAARRPIPDRTAARGIRLGLAVSLLGMLVAFPMTMPFQAASDVITGAHSVGVPDGGPGLPVTGWSTTGGDLRVAHFVGLHALQALPLLAWWLTGRAGRVARLDEATRGRLLAVAAVSYSVLVGGLTWQALRGQPLLRPDALTLAALAVLVAATAAAVAAVLRAGRRPARVERPERPERRAAVEAVR